MPLFDSQLRELRQQLPIGLRHALQLLARTQGDAPAAAQLFRQEMTDLLMSKTGIEQPRAEHHLAQANYDLPVALQSSREEQLTLTARLLLRYRTDVPKALNQVQLAVEGATPLRRNQWLEVTELEKLNRPQACVVLLCEWLDYQEWEGLPDALYFHLDLVVAQLRQELQQLALADTLLAMRTRYAALREHYAAASFETATSRLADDKRLQGYEAEFEQHKPLLLERMHSYVQEHIGSFP